MTIKLEIPDDWTATPENVNALPEPLRRYIHDLQTNTDPAGLLRENFTLRQENAWPQAGMRKAGGATANQNVTTLSKSRAKSKTYLIELADQIREDDCAI